MIILISYNEKNEFDKITGIFNRFGVILKDVKSIKIEGPQILSKLYNREDFIVFDRPTQSNRKPAPLKSVLGPISGLKNNDNFRQGQNFMIRVTAKNTDKNFWLDPKSNVRLYDTANGSVFLIMRWYQTKEKGFCHSTGQPIKEMIFPVQSIIVPNQITFFNIRKYIPQNNLSFFSINLYENIS